MDDLLANLDSLEDSELEVLAYHVFEGGTLRLHQRVADVQDNKRFKTKHVSLAEHAQRLVSQPVVAAASL